MSYLMDQFDNSTAWFICALLALVLVNIFPALLLARRDLRNVRRTLAQAEIERETSSTRMYDELETPAYLRKARQAATQQTR
jgi:hypothetical protein